jgi:hypothetical protein
MTTWLKAVLEFAAFYSYRMPETSPQYALASPVPSPAALKLALVDTAIQMSGDPAYGRRIFGEVKSMPLWALPPRYLCVLKFFTKRLKKPKTAGEKLVESTAVREYCHLGGPLEIYLEVSDAAEMKAILGNVRRLGTSDSLLTAKVEDSEEPPPALRWQRLQDLRLPIRLGNYQRRMVVTLTDLRPGVDFDEVNPYSQARQRKPFAQYIYILPLVQEKRGENWVLYKRVPFELNV